MKTLVYSKSEQMLDGFKFGIAFNAEAGFTQGVDERGYWLLIESDIPDDNQTYELSADGLVHTDTGVEV